MSLERQENQEPTVTGKEREAVCVRDLNSRTGVVGAVQIQLSVAMRMYRNTEACHSTRHFQHSTEVDVQAGLGLASRTLARRGVCLGAWRPRSDSIQTNRNVATVYACP